MKLKVCGMNLNTVEVAALRPDYLGFIFWEPSKRYFNTAMPTIEGTIKKVGVFVDAPMDALLDKIRAYDFGIIQLHGNESPEYCIELRSRCRTEQQRNLELIKVFSIKDTFDFTILEKYEPVCDYYLFDTKGKLPGGNGYSFDWHILDRYPSTKPYFLSGGIGGKDIATLRDFLQRPEAKYCHAIDVNSGFELEPGLKNIDKLRAFKDTILNT